MLLNKVLFPAPKPPHYTVTSHSEHLFWLPSESPNDIRIPCMFYAPERSQRKIEYFMIFCHGNGCDIGTMTYTLNEFANHLNMYVISFEYPSYGLCTAKSPNQQTINNHADRTLNFVRNTLKWPLERIIIYGHSIGSGSGCYLAATNPNVGALILQSPYTAINNLVKEKVGIFSVFVGGRSWNNLDSMKKITCPVLFIHGLDDTLIPSHHSQTLYEACLNTEGKKLVLLRNEDHNSMSDTTLMKYIKPFLGKQCKITDNDVRLPTVRIDDNLRQLPENLAMDKNSITSSITDSLTSMSKASTSATRSAFQSITGKKNESQTNE